MSIKLKLNNSKLDANLMTSAAFIQKGKKYFFFLSHLKTNGG